jgi:hypothetical protein
MVQFDNTIFSSLAFSLNPFSFTLPFQWRGRRSHRRIQRSSESSALETTGSFAPDLANL